MVVVLDVDGGSTESEDIDEEAIEEELGPSSDEVATVPFQSSFVVVLDHKARRLILIRIPYSYN